MPSSTVIRIDQEVRAELQRRARPLNDTPNSVLRQLLGLPEQTIKTGNMNPRVTRLLELVQELLGHTVHWQRHENSYVFLGGTGRVVAHIRPQREKLRVVARKAEAEKAGLNNWDKERQDKYFGGNSVKWWIQDFDDRAYQRLAAVLEKLWKLE